MIKKFSQDPKIWINYASFLLSSVQSREATRNLLKRALQALPPDLHKGVISKFAKLEFRNGNPERGRTLFKNLLSTFNTSDKKNDLWNIFNIFIDIEIKYGGDGKVKRVRGLFKRALAKKFPARQSKALSKKWLEFEKKEGDKS